MGLNLATDGYPGWGQDIMVMLQGILQNGVYTGCAVTAQGTPNNTVAVSSGRIKYGSTRYAYAGTAASSAFTAADATNPRIDIVTLSNTGTLTITAGTAAATPVPPAIPANSVRLAYVFIRPTGAAPVIKDTDDATNAYIVDSRNTISETLFDNAGLTMVRATGDVSYSGRGWFVYARRTHSSHLRAGSGGNSASASSTVTVAIDGSSTDLVDTQSYNLSGGNDIDGFAYRRDVCLNPAVVVVRPFSTSLGVTFTGSNSGTGSYESTALVTSAEVFYFTY